MMKAGSLYIKNHHVPTQLWSHISYPGGASGGNNRAGRPTASWDIAPLVYVMLFPGTGMGTSALFGQTQAPLGRQTWPRPQAKTPAAAPIIRVVPNRPTFSTTADAVPRGVFEIELGIEAAKGHQNINESFKLGLLERPEIRFMNNPIERDDGTVARG
jgi:hypothetical protein